MAVILGRKGGGAGGGGGPPSGPAGGDLAGTYPNPTLAAGAIWENSFTESGASLANWTQDSGAWSVVANAFHVDTTGGVYARLYFNTAQGDKLNTTWMFEAEVMMEAAGVGTDAPIGIAVYASSTGGGRPSAQLFKAGAGAGTKQVRAELDASVAILGAFTPSPTWAFDTYAKLAMCGHAGVASILLNDVLIGYFAMAAGDPNVGLTFNPKVYLVCNNAVCNFKNIRLDYLPMPA